MTAGEWIIGITFGVFIVSAGVTFAVAGIKASRGIRKEPRTVILCLRDCVHKDVPTLGFQCDRSRVLIGKDGQCAEYVSCHNKQKGAL